MGSNSIPRKRPPRWPWGKASASRAEGPGFDPAGPSHTSDLNIGTPVATLPGAWRDRVSAGTGGPGVSILLLGEVESVKINKPHVCSTIDFISNSDCLHVLLIIK